MPYSVMLDAGHGGYQLCRSKERSIYPQELRLYILYNDR